jgi:hypothetical protein
LLFISSTRSRPMPPPRTLAISRSDGPIRMMRSGGTVNPMVASVILVGQRVGLLLGAHDALVAHLEA